jgi:DNA-binding FadR family transcriptional regulator
LSPRDPRVIRVELDVQFPQTVGPLDHLLSEWGESILGEHRTVFEAIKDCEATLARKTTRLHFERAAHRLIVRADFADI